MTPGIHKILTGAATGFVTAVVIDLNAWTKATGAFDWNLAVKRWISGALTGGAAAAGISAVGAN